MYMVAKMWFGITEFYIQTLVLYLVYAVIGIYLYH